jgi:hypothetical protein
MASGSSGPDADGDFLVASQEHVLGTSPQSSDSDLDGFSDLEELARASSPVDAMQIPTTTVPTSVGMTAHGGEDGQIHVLAAVYSTLANPRQVNVTFGVQIDQRMFVLSNEFVASHGTYQITSGASGQSLVHLVDLALSPAMILAVGEMTIFAKVGVAGFGTVYSADTVRLSHVDGVVVLIGPPPRPTGSGQGGGVNPIPAGSIYTPLPHGGSGGSIPSTWSQGEICLQHSAPVGVNGPVVTQEVISANCVNGFEGYCPPGCVASVGSTYSTLDPLGLIGG